MYKCVHATQVIGKRVFYLLVLCGNNVYAFITGDPVKRHTVDNIIVENLIQSLISGTISRNVANALLNIIYVVYYFPYVSYLLHPSSSVLFYVNCWRC